MTDAELAGLLTDWGNQFATKTERQRAHDAAAREFAERNLASKSGASFLDVGDVRYSLGEDGRVKRSLPV